MGWAWLVGISVRLGSAWWWLVAGWPTRRCCVCVHDKEYNMCVCEREREREGERDKILWVIWGFRVNFKFLPKNKNKFRVNFNFLAPKHRMRTLIFLPSVTKPYFVFQWNLIFYQSWRKPISSPMKSKSYILGGEISISSPIVCFWWRNPFVTINLTFGDENVHHHRQWYNLRK